VAYIEPKDVHSPKARWKLVRVLKAGRAGECAYALGVWDGQHRIGFRWNGDQTTPLGNPQSRGLPTWTMLDEESHELILDLLSDEEKIAARDWLGMGLMFAGVTLSTGTSGIALWDIGKNPPVIARIRCDVVKDGLAGDPTLSNEDCRLLVESNKELITQVANNLFDQKRYSFNDRGCRIIEIESNDLKPLAKQFSTSVLRVKAQWLNL